MNLIKKYLLYRKMINPGPAVSVKDEVISSDDFTRIEWVYRDNENTYQVRSYKLAQDKNCRRYEDFYYAWVYLNGMAVAGFTGGRMARNLYNKAAAVMGAKSR